MKAYFFDTYALYEVITGNPDYLNNTNGVRFVCTKMNLLELHYAILRTYSKEHADSLFEEFSPYCKQISDDTYKEASAFRFRHKEKKLSYVDCIGYCMARRLGIKFLTGDNEFKGLENVEFVR